MLLAVAGWWFSKPFVEDAITERVAQALTARGFESTVDGLDWDRRGTVTIAHLRAQRPGLTVEARAVRVRASMHFLVRGALQVVELQLGDLAVEHTLGDAALDAEDAPTPLPKRASRPTWLAIGAQVEVAQLRLDARQDDEPLASVRLDSPVLDLDGDLGLKGSGTLTLRDAAPVNVTVDVRSDDAGLLARATTPGDTPLIAFAAAPHGRLAIGGAQISRRGGVTRVQAANVVAVLGDLAAPDLQLEAQSADLDPRAGLLLESGALHVGVDPRQAPAHARALLKAWRASLGQLKAPPLPAAGDAEADAESVERTVRLERFDIFERSAESPVVTDATIFTDGRAIEVEGAFAEGHISAKWQAETLTVTADDVKVATEWSGVPLGGRLTGTASLRRDPWRLRLDGSVADEPILGINAGFKGEIAVDKGSISFEKARIRLGAATAVTTLTISQLPDDPLSLRAGMPEGFKPLIDLRAEVEPLRCDAAIKGVPLAILGPLQGVDLAGFFHPTIRLRLPFGEPTQVRFEATGISEDGCEVEHLHLRADGRPPADVAAPLDDVAWLNADFVLPVREGVSDGVTIQVGPGTPDYVRLEEMPGYVGGAAYLSEEMGFYVGSGISIPLIAKALGTNLARGRFAYGGSTVTQQLVKNLFLTRKKTLARKFQEAIIAARIARAVSKDRVLELYLNCIEFGPDLYGIGPAARHYFDKGAQSLTPMEAVFLAMLKPAPRRGAWYRRQGRTPSMPYWDQRARLLLERLEARGLAPAGTADGAAPYVLRWSEGRYLGPPRVLPIAPASLESPDWD